MSMMTEIDEFVTKYSIGIEGKEELIIILNKSLIEISKGILETSKVKENKVENKVEKKTKKSETKRYKSKKAEEYAEEHGLSLEDFSMFEISKKDVEDKVRDKTKNNKEVLNTNTKTENITKDKGETSGVIKSKERVICSGINKKGESCKSVGTILPDGAKKKYCFRHAEDFRSFECDSDSSDEEEEELKEEPKIEKELDEELGEELDEELEEE
jgi:hypothetical protein